MLIDTHAHLYAGDFNDDRDEVMTRALAEGVEKIILPNIDHTSAGPMLEMVRHYPERCIPLMGLHPTSVDEDYTKALDSVERWFRDEKFFGVGEIGIDLYWDTTRQREQEEAFRQQLRLARTLHLPVVIHVRNSFDEVWSILEKEHQGVLKGIFHCFSGTMEQALEVIGAGFFLGIGGVVTYKNNTLAQVVQRVGAGSLVLETDAPWLSPVPFRGRRNESAYLVHVAGKVASLTGMSPDEVAEITTANARKLFGI